LIVLTRVIPLYILDKVELLLPMGLNKYDTSRILPVKCYIDNSVRLQSCIRNVNNDEALAAENFSVGAIESGGELERGYARRSDDQGCLAPFIVVREAPGRGDLGSNGWC
jgi:hypothetical protein